MNKSTCPVDDSSHSKGYLRHGMCEKHYIRFKKYGSPLGGKRTERSCVVCSKDFVSVSMSARYCTDKCRYEASAIRRGLTCCRCGKPIQKGRTSRAQGEAECLECSSKHDGNRAKKGCDCENCRSYISSYMRGYKEKVLAVHGVGPSSVFKRRFKLENGYHYGLGSSDWISQKERHALYELDSWVCHLCDKSVDRDAHWNDNLAPSLDHLIPRSHGGSDDPDNLKTAHRLCNSIRQDAPLSA